MFCGGMWMSVYGGFACRDGAGMDEEDYIDTRMFEKSEDRLTEKARQHKQVQKAIHQHHKWNDAIQKCHLCMESPAFKKHMMISLGKRSAAST